MWSNSRNFEWSQEFGIETENVCLNFAASIGLCNFTVKRFMSEKVVFQELDKLAWHI